MCFGSTSIDQPAEASIVDKLQKSCPCLLSLAAHEGDDVVGHALFSPVKIEDHAKTIAGLVPVVILPELPRSFSDYVSRLMPVSAKVPATIDACRDGNTL